MKKAVADGVDPDSGPTGAMDRYSYWFDKAYPHAAERQKYLQNLIQGQPISAATLRLAHILQSGQLANIVVTPNFDDMITRGLSLFGKEYVVCDHPQTVPRIDPERSDAVQIVHVHGTYWFYDCCNLREEIHDRSEFSSQTTITMGSLLDRLFANRSAIVVGYSGWESDVIMSALRRRLQGQNLAYRLYWFCYRAADIEQLPTWLQNHRDIRFVSSNEANDRRSNPATSSAVAVDAASASESTKSEAVLSARDVMDALVRGFSLDAPKLTSDPMAFYAAQLKESIFSEQAAGREDLYGIEGVISRIEHGRDLERNARQTREDALERVRDALRRSVYHEVVSAAHEVDAGHLSAAQYEELFKALEQALQSEGFIQSAGKAYAEGCDLAKSIAQKDRFRTPGAIHSRIAWALNRKASQLYKRGQWKEAIPIVDEVLERFGADTDPALQSPVASALHNKGVCFANTGRFLDAISVYEKVIADYPLDAPLTPKGTVAFAYHSRASALEKLGRLDEAEASIRTAAELLKTLADPEPVLVTSIAAVGTVITTKKAAKAKADAEARAKAETEAIMKAEAEARAKSELEAKAKADEERKSQAGAESVASVPVEQG